MFLHYTVWRNLCCVMCSHPTMCKIIFWGVLDIILLAPLGLFHWFHYTRQTNQAQLRYSFPTTQNCGSIPTALRRCDPAALTQQPGQQGESSYQFDTRPVWEIVCVSSSRFTLQRQMDKMDAAILQVQSFYLIICMCCVCVCPCLCVGVSMSQLLTSQLGHCAECNWTACLAGCVQCDRSISLAIVIHMYMEFTWVVYFDHLWRFALFPVMQQNFDPLYFDQIAFLKKIFARNYWRKRLVWTFNPALFIKCNTVVQTAQG